MSSRIDMARGGRLLKLTFSGALSETTDYADLKFAGLEAVEMDLAGVDRVNSAGIMHWTRFLQTIPADVRVTLLRCSVTVMHQVQIFPLFLDNGRVKVQSFFLEYDCRGCSAEAQVLLDMSEMKSGAIPKKPCGKCGGTMHAFPAALPMFLTRAV